MFKKIGISIVLFFILFFIATPTFAVSVLVSQLIEEINYYNGTVVMIEGQAIGNKMGRRGKIWVNVLDSSGTAIGVLLSERFAEKIKFLGDYRHHGDMVRIKGSFFRADPSTGGEICIKDVSLCEIITKGIKVEHFTPPWKKRLAWASFFLMVVLFSVWRRKRFT